MLLLRIDCLEEVLDYLNLYDLNNISKTCKWLQQVIIHIFKKYYPFFLYYCLQEKCRQSRYYDWGDFMVESANTVYFNLESSSDFTYFLNNRTKLHSVKLAYFDNFEITATKFESIKVLWEKLEQLVILHGDLNVGKLHENVLKHCSKLKQLCIQKTSSIGTDWLIQKYPKMEQLTCSLENMSGLANFLELNPNISTFVTSVNCLWSIRSSMMTSKISVKLLGILCYDIKPDFGSFYRLLNRLYKRGIYKRLKFTFPTQEMRTQEKFDRLASLNGLVTLKNITDNQTPDIINLSSLKDLKKIYIEHSNKIKSMDNLAINLTKLEHFQTHNASFNEILPLISQSVNLKAIFVLNLTEGKYFNGSTNIMNLPELKKVRERLLGASKIILHLNEKIYLATKWSFATTYFGIIRILRNDSIYALEEIVQKKSN